MTLLLNLFLAHILADFVFQSNALIKAKHDGVKGQAIHAGVVTILTGLVLFPYGSHVLTWVLIATVGLSHFIQDTIKISAENRLKKSWSTFPFFVDQILHLAVLFFVFHFLADLVLIPANPLEAFLFFNEDLSMPLVFLLIISFVLDIVIFQFKRRPKKKQNHRRDYLSMLLRLLAFVTAYLIILLVFRFFPV